MHHTHMRRIRMQFANVILLNKADLVDKAALERVRGVVAKLNSEARIIDTVRCQVPLESVLNTRLFDMDKASESEAWIREVLSLLALLDKSTNTDT
jgi:G3E family GTPase